MRKLNERVSRRATELVAASRLNVYKKAKLGSRLQDLLVEAGYPGPFAKQFAYEVTALVATADAGRG